jgi:hypothetical protein
LAKQLAHKEIYEQLCQIYELNNQMESTAMEQSTSSTMAAENNLVKNEEQIEQNEVEKRHKIFQLRFLIIIFSEQRTIHFTTD